MDIIKLFESAYNMKMRQMWGYLIKDEKIKISPTHEQVVATPMDKQLISTDIQEELTQKLQQRAKMYGIMAAVGLAFAAGVRLFCYRKKIKHKAVVYGCNTRVNVPENYGFEAKKM